MTATTRLASTGITEAIAIVKPEPHDGTLELMITFCQQEAVIFTAPLANVAAAAMDFSDGARPGDNNGVVSVSLLVASRSKAQMLSILLRKSDQNVCRMLLNLASLKVPFLGTALFDGGVPSARSKVVRALVRAGSTQTRSISGSFAFGLGAGWCSIAVSETISNMPGLRRVASVVEEWEKKQRQRTPPLDDLLKTPPMRRTGSPERKDSMHTDSQQRVVNAYIERRDELAVILKSTAARKQLEEKWCHLRVFSPAHVHEGQSFDELSGTIVAFEWRSSETPPCNAAVVEDDDGGVWPVGVQSLPEMVLAATQPGGVTLELPHVDNSDDSELAPGETHESERILADVGDGRGDDDGDASDDDSCDDSAAVSPAKKAARTAKTPAAKGGSASVADSSSRRSSSAAAMQPSTHQKAKPSAKTRSTRNPGRSSAK